MAHGEWDERIEFRDRESEGVRDFFVRRPPVIPVHLFDGDDRRLVDLRPLRELVLRPPFPIAQRAHHVAQVPIDSCHPQTL
jgi:hypothetical protein